MNRLIICGILSMAMSVCTAVIFTVIRFSRASSKEHDDKGKKQNSNKEKAVKKNEKRKQTAREKGRFEKKLYYSGISRKYSFITAEWYFVITLAAALAACIPAYNLTRKISTCAAVIVLTFACMYMVVIIMANHTYKNVDGQLVKMTNLIDNFSKSSNGDLMSLLRNVSFYLDKPLNSIVHECVDEAAVTGDESSAIERMKQKVEPVLFSDIITNLTIASRHESNYADVIAAYRKILREHSAAVQNKKSIVAMARANIMVLVAVSAVIFAMINGILSSDLMSMFTNNTFGIGVIVFVAVIFVVIIGIFISIGKNSD